MHMAPETILDAKPEHLSVIMQIEQLCFGVDAFNIRQMRYLIHADNPFFVIYSDLKLAGYVILLIRKKNQIVRLYALAVHPDFRGKGLASKLLQKTIELSQQLNMKQISLEVRVDNVTAIKLYQQKGFQISKQLPQYYKDQADGYKMKLKLSELK